MAWVRQHFMLQKFHLLFPFSFRTRRALQSKFPPSRFHSRAYLCFSHLRISIMPHEIDIHKFRRRNFVVSPATAFLRLRLDYFQLLKAPFRLRRLSQMLIGISSSSRLYFINNRAICARADAKAWLPGIAILISTFDDLKSAMRRLFFAAYRRYILFSYRT